MLCNVEQVQSIPGMMNQAAVPVVWLNSLLGAADRAIKTYLKREIELDAYEEYYSGAAQTDLTLRQYPVLKGQTTVAAASNGVALPVATINVASTAGFHPGTGANPHATSPSVGVQTGPTTWTAVTYTGTTATSFTGCSGGTGTLSSADGSSGVFSPLVSFDANGYYGQAPNSFGPGTLFRLGTQYALVLDAGGKVSNRGLIRRIAGSGQGFVGFYPEVMYSGKLGARNLPSWPRGEGNILVRYSAGYANGKVPMDIQYACALLVAQMVRIQPVGMNLSSESLGAYTYSVLEDKKDPEMGTLRRILAPYREVSFGWP